MSFISSLSHHATLFVYLDRKALAKTFWEELSKTSPAHIFHDHTVLDIDTARELKSWAVSAYSGEKVALLSFHTITIPAQNALLKILEEPRPGVRFVLVTSNSEMLIPTLLSRLQQQHGNVMQDKEDVHAKLFLSTKYEERMKLPYVTNLVNAVDEENRKDREAVRSFIVSLAKSFQGNTHQHTYVCITLEMASYMGNASNSGKTVLEYLALLLPEVKA